MALEPLSAGELADSLTLFESFMGYMGRSHKTFGQLLAIYRERSRALSSRDDRSDDLRIDRFIVDMSDRRWRDDVVIRVGVFDDTMLAIDGIHRGIAYLACIERGISPESLPALHVSR